jgi:sugar phosphate isomerase/epimerase
MARVGLMLYTLRDECERDLEGTLRAVAELGYEGVEFDALHGNSPERVRALLDELGLVAVGRHAELAMLEANLHELAEELRTLEADRIALSWIEPPRSRADGLAKVERLAGLALEAQEAGLRLGFHNHGSELTRLDEDGTFLDLLRELPKDLLWFELDLGWVWHAGVDPVTELQRTRGRCPLVHVKDFSSRDDRDDVPVGEGAVGYERVVPAAVDAGVEWLLVEEDDVAPPAFDAVARSLSALRSMLSVQA